MRKKLINLKHYPIFKAKKAMKRLHNFVKKLKIKIQLKFILPYYRQKQVTTYRIFSKSCPYCGSSLKKTHNGIVCSQDKIREIWVQLRELRTQYAEKAEYFLSSKQHRFYYMFLKEGRIYCGYCQGNEELKWRKGPLY